MKKIFLSLMIISQAYSFWPFTSGTPKVANPAMSVKLGPPKEGPMAQVDISQWFAKNIVIMAYVIVAVSASAIIYKIIKNSKDKKEKRSANKIDLVKEYHKVLSFQPQTKEESSAKEVNLKMLESIIKAY